MDQDGSNLLRFGKVASMHLWSLGMVEMCIARILKKTCKDGKFNPYYNPGWWFGTLFIFPYIGNNHPNWRTHIFVWWGKSTINGWWFGTWILWLSYHIGNVIIPTDEVIFLRGVETTNQPILQQFFEVTMVSINIKILVEFSKDGYHGHGLRIFRGRHWANLATQVWGSASNCGGQPLPSFRCWMHLKQNGSYA